MEDPQQITSATSTAYHTLAKTTHNTTHISHLANIQSNDILPYNFKKNANTTPKNT